MYLANSKKSKKASVAGTQQMREKVVGDEEQEVSSKDVCQSLQEL